MHDPMRVQESDNFSVQTIKAPEKRRDSARLISKLRKEVQFKETVANFLESHFDEVLNGNIYTHPQSQLMGWVDKDAWLSEGPFHLPVVIVHGIGMIFDALPTSIRWAAKDPVLAAQWLGGKFGIQLARGADKGVVSNDLRRTISRIRDEANDLQGAVAQLQLRHEERWGRTGEVREDLGGRGLRKNYIVLDRPTQEETLSAEHQARAAEMLQFIETHRERILAGEMVELSEEAGHLVRFSNELFQICVAPLAQRQEKLQAFRESLGLAAGLDQAWKELRSMSFASDESDSTAVRTTS